MSKTDDKDLLAKALDILEFLNDEGDHDGRCVLCKSSPCLFDCGIREVLEASGRL